MFWGASVKCLRNKFLNLVVLPFEYFLECFFFFWHGTSFFHLHSVRSGTLERTYISPWASILSCTIVLLLVKSRYLESVSRIFCAFIPFISTLLSCRTIFIPFGLPSGRTICCTSPLKTVSLILGCFPPGLTFICCTLVHHRYFCSELVHCQTWKSACAWGNFSSNISIAVSTCARNLSLSKYLSCISRSNRASQPLWRK